eukprot:3231093-Rhodomonas_salina.2
MAVPGEGAPLSTEGVKAVIQVPTRLRTCCTATTYARARQCPVLMILSTLSTTHPIRYLSTAPTSAIGTEHGVVSA